jgi:3',5'-cyclic AMP phosphodiesterase CpdA
VLDAWLMLGDNAYDNGTDAEYQRGLFAMYPATLAQAALWPTLGNHDTAGSTNPPANLPYFLMFSLPTAAEAGGRPSGTERYYSFDVGDIHFVCLDSQTSSRAADGAMLRWLADDLASTRRTWIVAYWHHPPYSRGGHDSDVAAPSPEMRQNVVPVLEAGGVDLVLAGHSHVYERSFLIDGHYGRSGTFAPSMRVDGGDGREDGDGAYEKPRARTPNAGAVYVVAGSSASVSSWTGGSTALVNPTPHAVMRVSLRALGSLVIDADPERMDVVFVRETGAVDDYFTIRKPAP